MLPPSVDEDVTAADVTAIVDVVRDVVTKVVDTVGDVVEVVDTLDVEVASSIVVDGCGSSDVNRVVLIGVSVDVLIVE